MKSIEFHNYLGIQDCLTDEDENILSSLLRSYTRGIRYGCQMGFCHQCLMRLKKGEVQWIISKDERAELELMSDEILACQCKAMTDVTLEQK